ncbi:hypothetical protein HN014_09270 [Aquimarina sp. TRL1]|uniref:type VI secretion system tube protein TssD n=1 Tax=Aquimarina sp. (strain TRL1) TaxID=2736252 RepID=UPI00158851AE|nr:type VI secretion system tube protein TssD [Aquimarina sp. TRL1]QKX05100.1 hypothetical protein HN014_09270 [Aquimarina sp. TRL1]
MGFKAELTMDNKVYPLLLCDYEFSQTADHTGRPNPYITAGIIDIRVPMTRDDVLVDWVLQPSLMKKGTITIYKYDLSAVETTINFYNAHGLHYHLEFDAESAQAAYIDFRISAGELHLNELIHENRWNPERHQAIVTPREEETVLNPRIVSGWWSYDREGKDRYLQEKDGETIALKLEQSMYFHVETAEIPTGGELQLQLFDYDNTLGFDHLNADTDKFPNDPVNKNAIVQAVEGKSIATVPVKLEKSWEPVITDDWSPHIELYWDISYTKNDGVSISATMPRNQRDYLKVALSDRTLYIKTPVGGYDLPEFISYEGEPMLLMELGKGMLESNLKDKALGIIEEKAAEQIKKIAFTKLNKGYLVDNNGKLYTNERLVYKYHELYTNSGEVFENVERAKNFGFKHQGKPLTTTKGISQYDYFAKNGKRVTVLRMLTNVGNAFNVFSFLKAAEQDIDPTAPLPLDFGPLSPIADLTGVLAQEMKADLDEIQEEIVQQELLAAKLQGLEAVKKCVRSYDHTTDYQWELIDISDQTANKLLKGEFKTFKELRAFDAKIESFERPIKILYRNMENKEDQIIQVIETIFLNY